MGHSCDCHDETTNREEVIAFALDTLRSAREEAEQGRPTEAQTLNLVAQTALALGQLASSGDAATLTGGPH